MQVISSKCLGVLCLLLLISNLCGLPIFPGRETTEKQGCGRAITQQTDINIHADKSRKTLEQKEIIIYYVYTLFMGE